jgi:hypothetical protein
MVLVVGVVREGSRIERDDAGTRYLVKRREIDGDWAREAIPVEEFFYALL